MVERGEIDARRRTIHVRVRNTGNGQISVVFQGVSSAGSSFATVDLYCIRYNFDTFGPLIQFMTFYNTNLFLRIVLDIFQDSCS